MRRGEFGGVLIDGSWSRGSLAAVVRRLQAEACAGGGPALLIAVDQEGGQFRRLPWAAPTRSAAEMGARLDAPAVREEGERTAGGLRAAGIDVDFAPVADTRASPRSFLSSRAFSDDPAVVGRLAAAFVSGLQAGGVAATAKHFPGLGSSRLNTDAHPVVIRASRASLERGLHPFGQAISAGVRLVMVSSAAYPSLSPGGGPAVLSPAILRTLLRGKLGFDGVVITDAMDAPAVLHRRDAPARAIRAGVDIVLYTSPGTSEAGYDNLLRAARRSASLRAGLARSYARIRALKGWLASQGNPGW